MNRTTTPRQTAAAAAGPGSLPRLLRGGTDLAGHLRSYGPAPVTGEDLVVAVAAAGLLGRGGAGFPTARKLEAVAGRRGPKVVVANGTEGEPLSAKDKTLLVRTPHLVLDGLHAAADCVGADRAILCIEDGNDIVARSVLAACAERPGEHTEIVVTPRRYLSGQETALVDLIDGGRGRPTARRPFERGVSGRPTLVDNVETLAQVALIARFGPAWYRRVGTPAEPGSLLTTVAGTVGRPGVYEVAHGQSLGGLLDHAGAGTYRAVLVGGYFGRWLPAPAAASAGLSRASLSALGADVGCGVVLALDDATCALDEVSRVAGWFSASSARQCGACEHGLRDLAGTTTALAEGGADTSGPADILRWTGMVRGRGGCRLPDGAATFLESAVEVFGDEIAEHRRGSCGRRRANLLPTPAPEAW